MKGRIKWFDHAKGYGFINCKNLNDIFVHFSAINMNGYKILGEGAVVKFQLVETDKGLQAIEVMEI